MATLHVTVFWCRDADPAYFRTTPILSACREIAARYDLSLEIFPQHTRDPPFVLDFYGDVVGPGDYGGGLQAMFDAANRRVRGLADKAYQGAGRLPVIFGTLNNGVSGDLYIGQTIRTVVVDGKTARSDWLPWCVVDPMKATERPHTLLHEMGHAAGAEHNTDMKAGAGELMVDGDITPPITIEPSVVNLFKQSYFCW